MADVDRAQRGQARIADSQGSERRQDRGQQMSRGRLARDHRAQQEKRAQPRRRARHDHDDPGRRFGQHVAHPAVQRKERQARGRGDDHRQAHRDLDPRRQSGLEQRVHVEALGPRDGVKREHTGREHAGAESPVPQQPPRRRVAPRSSPSEDEQRERDRRRAPEQDEQEHVARDDRAVDRSLREE